MRRSAVAILLFTTVFPYPQAGHADPILDRLQAAQSLVRAKEYSAAINQTQPLLDGLKLETLEAIILAHKILGVASCELGDQPKAQEHFKILLTFSVTEEISDLVVTKPCANLYAELQEEERPQAHKPKTAPKSVAPTPKNRPVPNPPVKEPTKTGGAWKRYLPLGVGQFANDQPNKGVAFLASEGALFATAGLMAALFHMEREPDGTFTHSDRADAYKTTFWTTLGVGTAIAVWGIVDAVTTERSSNQAVKNSTSFSTPEMGMVALRF
ncbi:MAG: hypothetical protein V1495_06735 [Pseudomonadota bacterium]